MAHGVQGPMASS